MPLRGVISYSSLQWSFRQTSSCSQTAEKWGRSRNLTCLVHCAFSTLFLLLLRLQSTQASKRCYRSTQSLIGTLLSCFPHSPSASVCPRYVSSCKRKPHTDLENHP